LQGKDHGTSLPDGEQLGQYGIYIGVFDEQHVHARNIAFDCRSWDTNTLTLNMDPLPMIQNPHPMQITNAWELAMNINPSDGHNFGWGAVDGAQGWPVDGRPVGSSGEAFTTDFMDSTAWSQPCNFIAIVRHEAGLCDAARVWQFRNSGISLQDYFSDQEGNPHQRSQVTTGGPLFTVENTHKEGDPIFTYDGDLVFNWFHANNGARIAVVGGFLSDVDVNDDDTHGLGNEFGAETHANGRAQSTGSTSWWHDVAMAQDDCHGGSDTPCLIQGSDHGTSIEDGDVLGSYAIFVGAFDTPHMESGKVALDCAALARNMSPENGATRSDPLPVENGAPHDRAFVPSEVSGGR